MKMAKASEADLFILSCEQDGYTTALQAKLGALVQGELPT